jgi:hypothetical protein
MQTAMEKYATRNNTLAINGTLAMSRTLPLLRRPDGLETLYHAGKGPRAKKEAPEPGEARAAEGLLWAVTMLRSARN